MVALELQSPAVQQRQSDTFQQVDPVAALQQLVIQHRTARVASSRAAQQKTSASNSPTLHVQYHILRKSSLQQTRGHLLVVRLPGVGALHTIIPMMVCGYQS